MIEAKEAKQIAWRNSHNYIIAQYNIIEKFIQEAAEEGKTEITYPFELYKEVKQILKDYGYKVSCHESEYDHMPNTIISWR